LNNTSYAEEVSEDLLTTDYYLSYDVQNGTLLFSNNINEKIYPASLTKLMTALILLDNYNLNDYLVTEYPLDYVHNGKVAYIPENTTLNVANLLELLLVYSANDAAYISAMAVSGNIEDFLFVMNNKAKAFGMTATNFKNPDGIDELEHYTTLNDLLIMTLKGLQNKEIQSIISKTKFVSDVSGVEKIYNSTNLLLEEGFVGIKTGWTDKAGLTFIGLNQTNNREIITIVNKSKVDEKKYSHFSDTKLLYKISIDTFKNFNIIKQGENIYNIRNSSSSKLVKSNINWIEFTNIKNTNEVVLTEYSNKNIIFSFNQYEHSFKIINLNNNVKWKFNPLKLFKINANQY
tara:strand:+ start:1689 stop:2726 length:1038 start_codon:yes stop_codon:yes gene_type:complete